MLTFKILGPLEVVRDGESLPLGPAKQRALVACLLLHPNETVSVDRLTDELWGQDAPQGADHNLHQYVSRLRKILDDHGRVVLVTRAPGYQIELGEEDLVDATLFERCVRQARDADGHPADALELLERGLAMWRGPALADFTYQGFAETTARRLEELRASAEEARIEALLALGRERDAITEAESLVQRFPLREHVRALQMLALYRGGRQSEALAAFQAARQALAAELGIDPGPELKSLEQAILRQDPELQLPAAALPVETSSVTIARIPAERAGGTTIERDGDAPRPRRRRSLLVSSGAVVLVALVTVIATIALRDDPTTPPGETGVTGETAVPGELRLVWQEAPSGDFVGPGDQRILGGVETATGFLVFGYTTEGPPNAAGKPDLDTAAWVGDPDQQWEAVDSPSFLGGGNQRATDTVIFGGGAIVLLGSSESARGFDAAAWILPAGSTEWARADVKAAGLHKEQDQSIRDAVQVRSQLIAVGSTGGALEADAALWESQRGKLWTFAEGAVPSQVGVEEMTCVVMSPEGLLVVGGFVDGPHDQDAAVWTTETPPFVHRVKDRDLGGRGDQKINAIVQGDPGYVAVGEETIEGDTDAVVWTSTDGREWERVFDPTEAFTGGGAQRMYAVAASDIGLVAAGTDVLEAGADDQEPDGHWDAAVWTSVDGLHWERLPGDDPSMSTLADLGHQEIKALVPVEGGFLALGAEGESGSDWDGRVWIGTAAP